MKNISPRDSGFTLIELAIVLLIAGLMLGGAMAMIKPYAEMAQRNATITKQENIAKSLASYAMMYGRLPCPGDPNPTPVSDYGTPRNSSGGTIITNNCGATATTYIGMVPFKVLGLTEDNVKDSYGNLMRYAVPQFIAGYSGGGGSGTPAVTNVHKQCLTDKWIISGTGNKNRNKAYLCCTRYVFQGGNLQEIVLLDANATGNNLYPGVRTSTGMAGTGGDYANVETTTTSFPMPPPPAANPPYIAYVLISAGKNGDGAYIPFRSTTKPVTVTGGTAAQEYENRNNDLTFASMPLRKTADANYFDDIVLWRSNQQLVSEFGNDSCAGP